MFEINTLVKKTLVKIQLFHPNRSKWLIYNYLQITMREIISLAKLISEQKIEKIDLFNGKKSLPLKSRQLYENLINGNIQNLEDVMRFVYNNQEQEANAKKLVSRLKTRLLNSLFFVDQSRDEFTDMRRAIHSISKSFVLFNILFERNERKIAISIANKTFIKAMKYEKTDFALYLARHLYEHYSIVEPSKKQISKFKNAIKLLSKVLHFELLAEEYYNEISNLYVTKKSKFSGSELTSMKLKSEELIRHQKEIKSFKFNLNTYNLTASYYILTNQHRKCIDCCKSALLFFDGKPYDDTLSKYMFRNNLILSAIPQRNFILAEQYTKENFLILSKGSYNWFNQCNYQFILLTAQGKYQKLYDLVLEVTKNKNYKKYVIKNQFWNVIEAYVHFLIRMSKIDPSKNISNKNLRPFSLTRFLNDVPKFSKDKRGLNVSILIIQYIFLLLDRKYSKLIDRLDALKQYSYRYLKNDESFRSNLFIKMLLKVADADFHPIAAERYTKEMYTKLLASNPSANFQSTEIEVIPYEKLWEIVMELLEKNRNKKSS